jgi:fructose/tagatose bisphosphate aldolase
MTSTNRRIIVHTFAQICAALDAAAALGVPVTVASAEGAGGYAGPLWFKSLVDEARRDHPQLRVTAVLDCGDEPGTALAALRAGIKRVRFTGPAELRAKLAAIAAELGATIESEVSDKVLDLIDERDPAAACRAFLARNEAAG